jgi:hypothetical protein
MRWMRVTWLLGLLLVVPAGAQDEGKQDDERIALARIAMEAQLQIGNLLHEKGDHAGALEAYRKAVAIYERAVTGAAPAPARARKTPPAPSGEEVEIPKEEEGVRPAEGRDKGAAAVDLALAWLAEHQDDDGHWDSDGFMRHDPSDDKCDGAGGQLYDVGLTGLSTLAFLGAGYTDRGSEKENPYAKTVRTGLRFLIQSQADDGVFGTRATHSFIYNHAIATLAMSEAFWMTQNPRYKKPAQDGVNFLGMARNPYLAWRYDPRGGENDTSVTAWCVAALRSAKNAGLDVDPDAFTGAMTWFEKMTDPTFGQVGYNSPGGSSARLEGMQDRFPADMTQAMTAAAITGRVFCGEDPRLSEAIRKGAALCLAHTPVWNPDAGSIDMYYWYWGTLAMVHVGGPSWRKWSAAMDDAIVKHQRPGDAGSRAGSWDPVGAWGGAGGRIYSTAMMTLCLEVYYRYDEAIGVR